MKRILIVDDSSQIRKLIRNCFEHRTQWFVCCEAENGEVAIRVAQEFQPDLVILDLAMPVMNGLQAAQEIAITCPGTLMVMFTIQVCEQLLEEARALGIKEVLSKADPLDQLVGSVCRLLDQPAA